jgi:hypothetical protein
MERLNCEKIISKHPSDGRDGLLKNSPAEPRIRIRMHLRWENGDDDAVGMFSAVFHGSPRKRSGLWACCIKLNFVLNRVFYNNMMMMNKNINYYFSSLLSTNKIRFLSHNLGLHRAGEMHTNEPIHYV